MKQFFKRLKKRSASLFSRKKKKEKRMEKTTITLEAATGEELRRAVKTLAENFGFEVTDYQTSLPLEQKTAKTLATKKDTMIEHVAEEIAETIAQEATTTIMKEVTAKKRGRKPKNSGVAAPKIGVEDAPEEKAPANAAFTVVAEHAPISVGVTASKETVVAALQQVCTLYGVGETGAVLRRFGFNRVSEITADKYADLVQACNAKIANGQGARA